MRIIEFVGVLFIGIFAQQIICEEKHDQLFPENGYFHGLLYGHANDSSNQTIFDRVVDRLTPARERNFTLNVPDMLDRTRARFARRLERFRERMAERLERRRERLAERLERRRQRLERHFARKMDRWIDIIDRHNQRSGDESNRQSFGGLRRMLESMRHSIDGKPAEAKPKDNERPDKAKEAGERESLGKEDTEKGLNVV